MSSRNESTQIQVRRAYERQLEPGEVIYEDGDEGRVLYIVRTGEVHLTGEADGPVTAKLGPGDFFGEMSVVLGEPRSGRAIAVGDTELLELDGETFEGMCVERPEIAIRMIHRLAVRLISAERRLAAMGLDEWMTPLVRYLASRDEGQAGIEMKLQTSLRQLAAGACLTLPQTHHALNELLGQKLVRLVDEELVVPDRTALIGALVQSPSER